MLKEGASPCKALRSHLEQTKCSVVPASIASFPVPLAVPLFLGEKMVIKPSLCLGMS